MTDYKHSFGHITKPNNINQIRLGFTFCKGVIFLKQTLHYDLALTTTSLDKFIDLKG
jgi:hypothetical protein